MNKQDIVGKTLRFEYSNETYAIEILNETDLRWERIEGENTGQGDLERYVFSKLDDGKAMVSWVEADGLGLSNVLVPSEGKLITHANMGRDVFENPGKLTIS